MFRNIKSFGVQSRVLEQFELILNYVVAVCKQIEKVAEEECGLVDPGHQNRNSHQDITIGQ